VHVLSATFSVRIIFFNCMCNFDICLSDRVQFVCTENYLKTEECLNM